MTDQPDLPAVAYRLHLPIDVPLGICTFQITTRADENGVEIVGPVVVAPDDPVLARCR